MVGAESSKKQVPRSLSHQVGLRFQLRWSAKFTMVRSKPSTGFVHSQTRDPTSQHPGNFPSHSPPSLKRDYLVLGVRLCNLLLWQSLTLSLISLIRLPGSQGASPAFQPQAFLRHSKHFQAHCPTLDRSDPRVCMFLPAMALGALKENYIQVLKKGRAGAATAQEQEVETRGVAPGFAPVLRERLQGKINAFIRPTVSLQRGRHPHTHTEPPRGPVHLRVNPKFSRNLLGSDQACARGRNPCL